MPTQKHRIMYVITRSDFGGAQSYVFDLAKHSKQAGFAVTVVCGGSGELISKLREIDVEIKIIDSFVRDLSLGKEIKTLRELRKVISDFKPDILHINSSKAGVLGTLAARMERVEKIIFTAHGWPFFEKRHWLWRTIAWSGSYLTALLSHHTICISNNDINNNGFPFIKNKLSLVYNGAHQPELFTKEEAEKKLFSQDELLRNENKLRLLSIGELTGNKNYQSVLTALKELKHLHPEAKIHYTIMGDGDLRTQLFGYIKKNNLENDIKLQGFVTDPYRYLNAFDAIIMPSKKEGLPYTLINSALAGIPIVASNVGGIPDIVRKTKNGNLIDSQNLTEVVSTLKQLHTDWQSGQLNWSDNREAKSAFAIEKMIENTFLIYNS